MKTLKFLWTEYIFPTAALFYGMTWVFSFGGTAMVLVLCDQKQYTPLQLGLGILFCLSGWLCLLYVGYKIRENKNERQ